MHINEVSFLFFQVSKGNVCHLCQIPSFGAVVLTWNGAKREKI